MKSRKVLSNYFVLSTMGLVLLAGSSVISQSTSLPSTSTIAPSYNFAILMAQRLTGNKLPVSDSLIGAMASSIAAGNNLAAANLAIADARHGYYNHVIYSWASAMSTRAEVTNVPVNDFITTVIGAARDNLDARTLLTGNYTYQGDPAILPAIPMASTDILVSPPANTNLLFPATNHYNYLTGKDISASIKMVNGQTLLDSTGAVRPFPAADAAGLITTLAFAGAHAVAGTNRRWYEYGYREFLCMPIAGMSDVTRPDNMIRRDVARDEGGNSTIYQTTCRGCHTINDGGSPVMAKYDWDLSNNLLKFSGYWGVANREDNYDPKTQADADVNGIMWKYNHHETVYPPGFVVTNTNWINNATGPANSTYFGWRSATSGSTLNQYGVMLSSASAYPTCMATKAFATVCQRTPGLADAAVIQSLAQNFQNSTFNINTLFAQVAARTECLGSAGSN